MLSCLVFPQGDEESESLDKERLNNIVESVNKFSNHLDISLDDSCQKILLDYLNEVTLATLEQAAMLAQHRGSSSVEEEDIHLVLSEFPRCPELYMFAHLQAQIA